MVLDRHEAGNALWLILLAIALLAGLTALVTRTGSQSEDTGGSERLSIQVSELFRYLSEIEMGIQNLLSRGCSENELSFWYDENKDGSENASDSYYNPNSPTNHSCHIFDAAGAGVVRQDFGSKYFKTVYYEQVGSDPSYARYGVGPSLAPDLYYMLDVNKAEFQPFCEAVNRRMGITPVFPSDPSAIGMASRKFTGNFAATSTAGATDIIKKNKAFCHSHDYAHTIFDYRLLAR